MQLAKFWIKVDGDRVKCELCPQFCIISDKRKGFCGVRKNDKGRLFLEIYGEITSLALDPIEKKPLYHYHPGEYILSIGTRGCNFHCGFCQNWTISQDLSAPTESVAPQYLIDKAVEMKSFGIAYTYNEPFIWYEFVYDTAKLARENGLENVLVTNGYVNEAPLKEILPFIDAMNIDIKSMSEDFYRNVCKGRLEPVLETAYIAKKKKCHIEITNLVIPTLNDKEEDFRKLTDWIADNLGVDTPLHFSRYFPCYKFNIPSTPLTTLKTAERIAKVRLKHVYLGNV